MGPAEVSRHYDELDGFYRELWGEDVHHGLWRRGDEDTTEATGNLTRFVAERVGLGLGERVCDVGCGYGGPAHVFAERYGARVYGITLSRRQAERAGRRDGVAQGRSNTVVRSSKPAVAEPSTSTVAEPSTPRGEGKAGPRLRPFFVVGDWLDNPFPDGCFDVVVAIESASHMADKARFLSECRRVLAPGGRLAVAAWLAAEEPRSWQRRRLLEPICAEGRLPGLATAAEYGGWMADAGFEVMSFDDLSTDVRRTWSVCVRRLAARLIRDADARRYLLDSGRSERIFALTVPRIWVAYRVGALRYGVLTARV